jgi:Kef-type K+ transport system membrane component KefB
MSISEKFLLAMSIIFLVPYAIWRVGRTEYYAPLVVVQIITGILLGPGILGAAYPQYYGFVFNPLVVQSLNGIAWWAVMAFVWIAGIELDLAGVWANRRESAITAGWAAWRRWPWRASVAGSAPTRRHGNLCWASAWPAPSLPCQS